MNIYQPRPTRLCLFFPTFVNICILHIHLPEHLREQEKQLQLRCKQTKQNTSFSPTSYTSFLYSFIVCICYLTYELYNLIVIHNNPYFLKSQKLSLWLSTCFPWLFIASKNKNKKPNYDAVSSIVLFYGIVLCMSKGQPLNRLWSLYRYAIKTGFIVIQNDLRTSLIGKSKFTTQNYFKKLNFDLLIYENFLEDE